MSKLFTNTGVLSRLILRRDRIRIPVWIISIVLFTVMIAVVLPDLYGTGSERQIMAETMRNPSITVMLGPGYGLDNYTDGAMMAHFMLVFSAVATGIMGILLTTRHTREDEEEGRIEMIRSLPVGTLSPLASTFIINTLTSIIIFILVGIGLFSLGIDTIDLNGSMLYGASLGAIAIFFSALTGLFAQLTSNNRASLGFSFSLLIFFYMLRGIGDVGNEALSLISPLGLILRTEVYVNNYWWPVFATLGISLLIFTLSLYLNSIRDLGAGFLPTRSGRKNASKFLPSPLGLSLRLQRTSIIAWIIGIFILGVSYGSILGDLEGFLGTSDIIKQMLPEAEGMNMTERFVTMLMTIMSILGTIPILIYVLKVNDEEKRNRTEQVLSKAVSRNSLLGSYTIISVVAAPLIQLMSVLGLWSAAVFVMDDVIALETFFKAGFVHLPAMWIMVGLAVLLIGFIPKLSSLTWAYLGYSFFVVYLGDMLQLPDWLAKLSPFGHIPQVPIEEVRLSTMVILIIIAILSIVAGFIGYNKRDIYG